MKKLFKIGYDRAQQMASIHHMRFKTVFCISWVTWFEKWFLIVYNKQGFSLWWPMKVKTAAKASSFPLSSGMPKFILVMYTRGFYITFIHATSCTADSLTSYIKEVLDKYHIDPSKMVCQCYDGASVMSGCQSGAQHQVQEFAPRALYIHCWAHCLNLALVDCAKSVPMGWEFFALVQALYTQAI